MILRRSLVALLAVLVSIPLLSAAARPEAPTPEVVSEVRDVTERAVAAPTWPYGPMEVQRWYNATHDPNIDRPTATRLTAWMNAVVENRLRDYLLAVYLSRVQTSSCSSPSSCASMVLSVFGRIAPAYAAQAPRVMYCESGGNPYASNGGRFLGLFQHMASAWAGRAVAYGVPGRPWYDGYANAVVAAHMVQGDGGWRQWECKP